MINVEDCVRHGWRYLRLKPYEVYELSHKEFVILSEESVEMTHDKREESAVNAIMNAVASRGKGKQGKIPEVSELYNRDKMGEPKEEVNDVMQRQVEAMEWLQNFNIVPKDEDEDGS